MPLAALLTLLLTSSMPAQDPWPALSLTPAAEAPDSLAQAGVLLNPTPGGLDVVMGLTCQTTPRASYLVKGAVVKIRIEPSKAQSPCPAGGPIRAYSAHLKKLKPKRYQVIVLQPDARGRWQPWKAAVAVVP
jgi:hypothetical protein